MDWEDDYNTQEDQPSARLDGDTEAMGSPMGTHDLRRSTVAGMVGEEERRRSMTPGTESQRPPQPLGTREAMPVSVSAGAMTSGRPHFGGGSLRSGRDTAPQTVASTTLGTRTVPEPRRRCRLAGRRPPSHMRPPTWGPILSVWRRRG